MTNFKDYIGIKDLKLWDGIARTFTRLISTGGLLTQNKIGMEVDVLNVYGSGSDYTGTAISAAIGGIGSSRAGITLTPGTWTVTTDITIPITMALTMPEGAILSVATGKTITINGPFSHNGLSQKFSGAGTIKFGFGAVEKVYPEWWGAINGTHSGATLVPFVQQACDSLPHTTDVPTSGGTVFLNAGFYLASHIQSVVIPQYVIVEDRSRHDHIYYYSGSYDAEFGFFGPNNATGGNSIPTVRIHNYGVDGKRVPTFIYSRGRADTSGQALLWGILGSNDYNAYNNVPAGDLVIAGGQGAAYTGGTVSVTGTSAVVTGSGTNWTSDRVGAIFTIDNQTTAAGIVKSVESTTSLTLENIWSTYGGATANTQTYLLQGGLWYGATTSDYAARLVLGQNYTWLFNSGNYASGGGVSEASPLHVGNGLGNYPAYLSYVFYGNRLRTGSINSDTLLKIDNGSGGAGQVGHILTSSDYAGAPTKAAYLNKATDEYMIGNDTSPATYLTKWGTLGATSFRGMATKIYAWGSATGTIDPPLDYGSMITMTLDGNVIIGNVAAENILVGQEMILVFTQGAVGSKTVAFGTSYKFAGSTFTMTATVGKIDVITFIAISTTAWVEKSRSQNQ